MYSSLLTFSSIAKWVTGERITQKPGCLFPTGGAADACDRLCGWAVTPSCHSMTWCKGTQAHKHYQGFLPAYIGAIASLPGSVSPLWELKAVLQFLADWWLWVAFVTADTTRILPGLVPWVRTFKHLAATVILQSFRFPKYYIDHKSSQIGPRYGFGNVMLHTQIRAFCFVFHWGKPVYVWGLHKSFRTNDLQAHLELSLYTYIPVTSPPVK